MQYKKERGGMGSEGKVRKDACVYLKDIEHKPTGLRRNVSRL